MDLKNTVILKLQIDTSILFICIYNVTILDFFFTYKMMWKQFNFETMYIYLRHAYFTLFFIPKAYLRKVCLEQLSCNTC